MPRFDPPAREFRDRRLPTAAELMRMPVPDQYEEGVGTHAVPTAAELMAATAPPASIGAIPVAASEGEFDAIAIHDDDDGAPADAPPDAPAGLTVVPTSTIDPSRPRTVAAGYDSSRRTLTVVFRDGTWWNYYDVTPLEWGNFKRARSKGRFILTYLNAHPYGPANSTSMSEFRRVTLVNLARRIQTHYEGYQAGQRWSKTGKPVNSKRGGAGTYGKRRGRP